MSERPWRVALSVQAAGLQASFIGTRVMVSYRALDLGSSGTFLGVLAASFAVPGLLASLPFGQLATRIGGARLALHGTIAMAVGTGLVFVTPDLWALVAAGTVTGLGYIAAMVGEQVFVGERSTPRTADGAFGLLTTAASFGQLIGPPTVAAVVTYVEGVVEPPVSGTAAGLLTALAWALVAVPSSWSLRRAERSFGPRPRPPSSGSPAAVVRDGLRTATTPGLAPALLASGAVLVAVDMVYAFLPAWATERDVPVLVVGWLLAVRAGVSVVSRVGLGRLVVRFGRKLLLLGAMLLGVVALAVLPLVGVPGAFVVMAALGVALGLPQPLTMAWTVGITEPAQLGAAMGLRLMSNRLAQVTIPVVVATLTAPLGVAGIFWATALVLAGGSAVVVRSDPDAHRDHSA